MISRETIQGKLQGVEWRINYLEREIMMAGPYRQARMKKELKERVDEYLFLRRQQRKLG